MSAPLLHIAVTAAITCFATVEAPKAFHAIKHHRAVKRHHVPVRVKPIARPVVPVCPPSGIATLPALPSYTPADFTDGMLPSVPVAKGYEHGTGRLDIFSPGVFVNSASYNPVGGGVQPTPGSPIMHPTPASALPEPGTWAMMLAGFGMVGLVARQTRRVAPSTNLGE